MTSSDQLSLPFERDPDQQRTFRRIVVREEVDILPDRIAYKGGNKYKSKRRFLYDVQGGLCLYCDTPFPIEKMTLDHIIPKVKGGTDHISNLVVSCGPCNALKGGFESFEEVALFVATRFNRTRREMERYAHLLAFFKTLRDKGILKR